jgi:hypothetical protein
MKNDAKPSFSIVEVDDEGWAAFKALEAEHRREYAASAQAMVDHEAWVNAPVPGETRWKSIPSDEQTSLAWPRMIPHPSQPPFDQLRDFAQIT